MEKFDYHFKIRNSRDISINLASIYADIAYKQFDKGQLKNIFNTSQQDMFRNNYLEYFNQVVKELNDNNINELNGNLSYLNQRWVSFKENYYDIIKNIFGIEFDSDIVNNLYCELQFLPINEINLRDGAIYLDCNQTNEEMFAKFIIMLTKIILLYFWSGDNKWKFNTNFNAENKIFMFADIAVDAIFYNSELKRICDNPSYKYFYNLNYQNVNMMQYFRQLYKNMEINKFLDEIYLFIYKNYSSLIQFNHYLY